MQLKKLRLFHYRNIKESEISLCSGSNSFIGPNAQGKTNLLEAIYFLGYGKSFRTNTPRDCIQHGHHGCQIEGTVAHGALTRELQVCITPAEKKLSLYGKPVPLNEFVGNLHLLAFTHEHVKIVRGGPAERRAFIDRAMISIYPGHLSRIAAYQRALKQRNRVLSFARERKKNSDEDLLESWDEALIKDGARILWSRLRYVEQMKTELPLGLFGSEALKIHYHSTVAAVDMEPKEIEQRFRQHLLQARSYDRKTGFTSLGPHRDDLKLFVNGKSLVDFGSAGQQRSCLISLYFSQMEIHRKAHGFYPVFLVDDIEAELDEQRMKTFLQYLLPRTQIFLTSAKDFQHCFSAGESYHFAVRDGGILMVEERSKKQEARSV